MRNSVKVLFTGLLVILFMLVTTIPALALDLRGGNTITIGSGEVIEGDLYIAGSDITINGTINGDVWAAGRSITINGTVNGAVTAAAQYINLNGPVARSARIAGQTLDVNGTIGTDLVAFGSTIDINSATTIGTDLLIGGATARIAGQVNRNLKGGADDITISGMIGGNTQLQVKRLTITSTANIKGNLDYTSENEATIEPSGQVIGKITHQMPEPKKTGEAKGILPWIAAAGVAGLIVGKILTFLMILVIAVIFIFTIRHRTVAMANSIKTSPWASLGWGALILFVTPFAAIIVCITLIGLPLGLIALALWGIAIYLSQIPVALCIGRLILRQKVESGGILVGAAALGLVILLLLRLIPVVGFLVSLATVLFGMGSLVTSRITLRAEPKE